MEDKDVEFEIKFIIKELKKALKEEKDVLEEINRNNKASYQVSIGNYKGEIKIYEGE